MSQKEVLGEGDVVIHYRNGKVYQILHMNVSAAGTLSDTLVKYGYVVYRNLEDGRLYVREASEFLEIFPDGTPRFKRLNLHYMKPQEVTR